jgi:Tol biopolymer transport system component
MKNKMMKSIGVLSLITILGALLSVSGIARQTEDPGVLLRAAIEKEEVDGDLQGAIDLYKQIVAKFGNNHAIAAKAQLRIGLCYEKLGQEQAGQAQKAFETVVKDYPDQTEAVNLAKGKLALLERTYPLAGKGDKELRIRKVREGSDVALFHSVSPDGKFASGADEKTFDLIVMELATGKRRSLTTNPELSWYPEHSLFSPDSRQIAFVWSSWKTELRIVGIDGSNPRTLRQNDYSVFPAGWSPDGRNILALVQDKDGPTQMVLVSVADGSTRILKTMTERPSRQQSFSPDGKYIAFSAAPSAGSKGHDIFTLATDGSLETQLTNHPANDGVLGWTPDGRGLLFASDRTGPVGAYIIRVVDGKPSGEPVLVKQNIGRIQALGFAKDGSFFYAQNSGLMRVNLVDIDPSTGKARGVPAPLDQPLDLPVLSLDWSPDGKSIVYVSDQVPETDRKSGTIVYDTRVISVRSLETGQERQISPPMKQFVNINWSPDGQSFLLRGYDNNGSAGLHIVDAQNGNLITSMPGGYWGSWSRGGKAVFYCKNDAPSKSTRLVARDLSSGNDKFLFPGAVGLSVAASPDGERLAFWSVSDVCILFVMTLKDGQNREIYRLKNEDFGGLAWSHDSRRIYFVRRNYRENKSEMWQIPAEGGEPQAVGLLASELTQISIHPDGKRMAYSTSENRSEMWVMENFLPADKAKK